MRIALFTLIALMLTCTELIAASQKPSNPIVISIQEESGSGDEGVHTLLVTIYSHVAISKLDVQLEVPNSMALLEGELSWQGAVSSGDPVRFGITGQFDASLENIITVTAKSSDVALAIQATAQYTLGSHNKLSPRSVGNHKPGKVIQDGERRLRVIPLEQQ